MVHYVSMLKSSFCYKGIKFQNTNNYLVRVTKNVTTYSAYLFNRWKYVYLTFNRIVSLIVRIIGSNLYVGRNSAIMIKKLKNYLNSEYIMLCAWKTKTKAGTAVL